MSDCRPLTWIGLSAARGATSLPVDLATGMPFRKSVLSEVALDLTGLAGAGGAGLATGGAGLAGSGFAVFGAGFGLGLAAGLSAYDPWFYGFYDAPFPYYGAYVFSPYPPPGYYGPPPPGAPPIAPPSAYQGGEGAEPSTPAACGSWVWDTAKQVYNWSPCASAPPA